MSAETESFLVIGAFFTVVAVVLSFLVIGIRRAGLRLDQWLIRKFALLRNDGTRPAKGRQEKDGPP